MYGENARLCINVPTLHSLHIRQTKMTDVVYPTATVVMANPIPTPR